MDTAFTSTVEGRNTFYVELQKKLHNAWRESLPIYERDFLIYLLAETVGKNKASLKASYNDFVMGGWDYNAPPMLEGIRGAPTIPPVGMSRSKLIHVIKQLVRLNAITVVPGDIDGTPSTYTVNLRWNQQPVA